MDLYLWYSRDFFVGSWDTVHTVHKISDLVWFFTTTWQGLSLAAVAISAHHLTSPFRRGTFVLAIIVAEKDFARTF
jgi:hypothetical protein